MKQTKLESIIEGSLNLGSGFIIALLMWEYIVRPWFGVESNFVDSLSVTLLFTMVSLVRGYLWRRFFNAGLHLKRQERI